MPSEQELDKTWRRFDKDGDGQVSLGEMLQLAEEDWTEQQRLLTEMNEPISANAAFLKGIDWTTEIVFFYGVLLGICWWEFKKVSQNQAKQRARIATMEKNVFELMDSLEYEMRQ